MGKAATKAAKPVKAPRFRQGTTDHDGDNKMGGSMSQDEAEEYAEAVLLKENGNVSQLVQDIAAYVRASRSMEMWKRRLFDDDHVIPSTSDVDGLLRGAVPSYDYLENHDLLRDLLVQAAESGNAALDLLRNLTWNEDGGLRRRYPDAFKDVAPAAEA